MLLSLHKLKQFSTSVLLSNTVNNRYNTNIQLKLQQLRYIIQFYSQHNYRSIINTILSLIDQCNYYLAPELGANIIYRHIQALIMLWCIHVIYRVLLRSPVKRIMKYIKLLFHSHDIYIRHNQLEYIMKYCKSYDEWANASVELDKLDNVYQWKFNDESDIYDYKRIQFELSNFQKLIDSNDIAGIMSYARARLMRNLVNINDRRLHIVLRAGTKRLIESYITTVVHALQLVCTVECDAVTSADKLAFFNETRHAFGRSALLLSGGATMALFHTGVVRALFENTLLPRVISGSSGGAIIASMLGTRTDDELAIMLDPSTNAVDFNFFPENKGSALRRLKRFWQKGVVLDINILAASVNANVAQLTFAEAYSKTGRIINISISPAAAAGNQESARICNYLTTPNLLVSSACLASCAIPGIYAPVELLCKNKDGDIVPYLESWNHGEKVVWEDGSVMSDLPMTRLSELFNVNNYIVSQVNPHIAPFVSAAFHIGRNVDTLLTNPVSKLIQFLALQLKDTALNLNRLGVLPLHPSARFVLEQQYMGDITITPNLTINDFQLLLVNPTVERYAHCQRQTELQTYRQLSTIRGLMEIELCLDECVRRMRGILILEELSQQKQFYRMSKTMSWTANNFDHGYDDEYSDSDVEIGNDISSTSPTSAPARTPTHLPAIREINHDQITHVPTQSLNTPTSDDTDHSLLPTMVRRQSSSPAEYMAAIQTNNKQVLGSNPRLSQLVVSLPQNDIIKQRTSSQPPITIRTNTDRQVLDNRSTSLNDTQCGYFQSVRIPHTILPVDNMSLERQSPNAANKQLFHTQRNAQSMLRLNCQNTIDVLPRTQRSTSHQSPSNRDNTQQPYASLSGQRQRSMQYLLHAARRSSSKNAHKYNNNNTVTSPGSARHAQSIDATSPISSSMISPKLIRAISDNIELSNELTRVTSLPHAVSQLELVSDCNTVP